MNMNNLDLNVLRQILASETRDFFDRLESGEEVAYIPCIIHMNGKYIESISTDVGTILRDYNKMADSIK